MKRRTFLRRISMPGLMGVPGLFTRRNRRRRPNLLFVLADQLRYDVFGHRRDSRAQTPNFDRFAAESICFSNATSCMPVCAAYRATLFTGKYPTTHGMVINEACMNPNHRAIGYLLHESDYRLGYLGKWHLMDDKGGAIPQGPARLGFQNAAVWKAYNFNHQNNRGYYWHEENGQSVRRPIEGLQTPFWTGEAIRFIQASARRDQPFALFLSYSPPHPPFTRENVPERYYQRFQSMSFPNPPNFNPTPDPYADRFKDPEVWAKEYVPSFEEWRKIYYAMVTQLDDELGRLMGALEANGVAENTIVVYTSDHGEMMGAHGRIQKMTFYEEAARIPFMVRWPGMIQPGARSEACLNSPDVAPTLLGLLGISVPGEMDGMDLSHCALGLKGPEPDAALLQGVGHTYQWVNGAEWRAMRDRRYTYARYLRDGLELLFDRLKDPYQLENLAHVPTHGAILDRLRSRMNARMAEIQDGFHEFTWYRNAFMAKSDAYSVVAGAKGPFDGPWKAIPSQREIR